MKKLLAFILVSVSCATFSYSWNPPDASLTTTSDTRTVTLSTDLTHPTQILTKDSWIQRNWIVNNSSVTVFISTANRIINISTDFGIPASIINTSSVTWSPDGVNSPYCGPLWAVANSSGAAVTVSIFRTK